MGVQDRDRLKNITTARNSLPTIYRETQEINDNSLPHNRRYYTAAFMSVLLFTLAIIGFLKFRGATTNEPSSVIEDVLGAQLPYVVAKYGTIKYEEVDVFEQQSGAKTLWLEYNGCSYAIIAQNNEVIWAGVNITVMCRAQIDALLSAISFETPMESPRFADELKFGQLKRLEFAGYLVEKCESYGGSCPSYLDGARLGDPLDKYVISLPSAAGGGVVTFDGYFFDDDSAVSMYGRGLDASKNVFQ